MHNKPYRYLTENNMTFNNQFGFKVGHSTNHELSELAVLQILGNYIWNKKQYIECNNISNKAEKGGLMQRKCGVSQGSIFEPILSLKFIKLSLNINSNYAFKWYQTVLLSQWFKELIPKR